VPITQAIQLQMVRNAPYADHLVRFSPTLSPVNLAPSAATIERACQWGRKSVERAIPVISALLEPIWWEGGKPAVAPAAAVHQKAAPMTTVMSAIRAPRTRFQRWRNRDAI
jgi:hypothetical protein